MHIAIDAGHGGHDPGAVADSGLREKDVALSVALRLADQLELCGHRVTLTRRSDIYLTLGHRCQVANNSRADVFVSIHLNAAADRDDERDPEGAETLYAKGSSRGMELAGLLQGALITEIPGHKNRGVKMSPSATYPRSLYVLHRTAMPAALVELEFISSRRWEDWLALPETHDLYARALAAGLKAYAKDNL